MAGGAGTTIGSMTPPFDHRPVSWRAGVIALAALAAGAPARAQGVPSFLRREVDLADFGVGRAAEVGWGRVSVVLAPEGERLEVNYLLRSAPEPATPEVAGTVAERGRGPEPAGTAPNGRGARALHSALWVWTTAELLADEQARADFLGFVEDQEIDRVFLQLVPAPGEVSAAGFVPFDGAQLGSLVADLRKRGALTYALDGDPRYIWPESREGVLRTVARVARHNRTAPPEQRFVGVRYDVEPYVLPGFQSPRRGEILTEYLELVAALSSAAHEAGLALGLDIPFWLDAPDEATREPFEAVVAGARTPVLPLVLELTDDVAVMAYRTVASGPNGVVEQARGEVSRAGEADVGVFVALETAPLPDELLYTFRGAGRAGLPTLVDATWVVLEERPGGGARIWLVEGAEALGALEDAARDAVSLRHWFAGSPVELPGDALSFYSLGAEAMRQVAREVVEGLGGMPAFQGLAYHDYRGLRTLLRAR